MNPGDLLGQASDLALRGERRPRQADLRRAISAAYYAVFHALCTACADALVGAGAKRRLPAWALVYRSLQHREARDRCANLAPLAAMMAPTAIDRRLSRFATAFVNLQGQRHLADYDPHARFTRSQALGLIATARRATDGAGGIPRAQLRDFAAHILFRPR